MFEVCFVTLTRFCFIGAHTSHRIHKLDPSWLLVLNQSVCVLFSFPLVKRLTHRSYWRQWEVSTKPGLSSSLLPPFSLPLLIQNCYYVLCYCNFLLEFSCAVKPDLSQDSHSCAEAGATIWLSKKRWTLNCSQGTQLLSRKKNGFYSELLSNSKEQAKAYKGEVKSCLVTSYIEWRFLVLIGKRKPEKAFRSSLLK